MKFEDLTIKQIVENCCNLKYCAECMIHDWCMSYLEIAPTDWKVNGYTDIVLPVEVKEVKVDQ